MLFLTWYGLWRFERFNQKRAYDKTLRDKTFDAAKNGKYDGCERGLASVFYKVFDKKYCSWWC